MADETPTLDNASADAVDKTKTAQEAIEVARQAQLEAAVEKTALRTKSDMLDVFKEVFGDSDSEDPQKMKVLVRRIPILCTSVEQMHSDIGDIKDNLKWGVRLIIGAVVVSLIALLFK